MNRLDSFLRIFTPFAIFLTYNSNNAQTNFWQQTNGAYGGLVDALILDDDDHIFAITTGSGIFRSSNNLENWTALNTGTTNMTSNSFAINSKGPISAGSLEGYVDTSITARIGQKLDC